MCSVWLFDPLQQTLEVYQRNENALYTLKQTFGGTDRVRAEPFESVELALLWG